MTKYNENYTYNTLQLATNDYVLTNDDLGIELNGTQFFSLDTWIKLDGLGHQTSILKKEGVFDLGIDENSVVLNIDGCVSIRSDTSKSPIIHKEDHHICVTFDGAQVRIYIDGVFNTFASISGGGSSNTNPFIIGNSLEGEIREIRIFNQVLDSDSVKYNMFNEPDNTSIVVYFDFTQNPPIDRSSSSLPLRFKGNSLIVKKSPALYLPSTAYAHPLQDLSVNPGGFQNDPYTIQSWIYIASKRQQKQAIFVNSDLELDTGVALFLTYDSVANGFRVNSQRGSNSSTDNILISENVIGINKWTNIATSFDGVYLSIYIDGVLDVRKQFPPITLIEQNSNLIIGATLVQGQPVGAEGLDGYISRIEIWDKALHPEELMSYINQTPETSLENLRACYNFMVSPPRNTVNGHPVGLADFAELTEEVTEAPKNSMSDKNINHSDETYGISSEMLQSFRDHIVLDDYFNIKNDDLLDSISYSEFLEFMPRADDATILEINKALQDYKKLLLDKPHDFKFAVTHHLIDRHYVIVCHNHKRSYIAGRVDASTISECEFLYIKLVFVAVAGILDALFGVSAKLTTKAQKYIKLILKTPEIKSILSVGTSISGSSSKTTFKPTTVFKLGAALYRHGFLKELINLIITVGFWAVVKIIAKAVLTFMGVGSAATIASLVATGITMGVVIAEIITKCGKKPPAISLASIQFNNLNNRDALCLRVNCNDRIELPEWESSRIKQYPVAYSLSRLSSNVPMIKATFTINTMEPTNVLIRATGGGVLGFINEKLVTFVRGVAIVFFPLSNINITKIVASNIQWNWQYKSGEDIWINLMASQHRIFSTIEDPLFGPWIQDFNLDNLQLPWADALEVACDWALNMETIDQVSDIITRICFRGAKLRYRFAQNYILRNNFKCTEFIADLSDDTKPVLDANCTDCATIITTFINLLGGKLAVGRIGTGFNCNRTIIIGYEDRGWQGDVQHFDYHDIAWLRGQVNNEGIIYDSCLLIDGGNNPWDEPAYQYPKIGAFPIRMQFTTNVDNEVNLDVPYTEMSYRERLVKNDESGIGHCSPTGLYPADIGIYPVI